MVQDEKAYYFKDLELALLLSIRGMKELFGMKINNIQNLNQKLIYQTLFELEKKEFIAVQKEHVTVDKKLNMILETISNAEKMFWYTNRFSKYPDQCIYLADRAVAVSVYGTIGGMYRIESILLSHLPEKICEYGFYIEEIVSNQSLLRETKVEEQELKMQAEILFWKEATALAENDWGRATNCLKLFSLKNRKCLKQYLTVKDKLKDYLTVTEKERTFVYIYSRQKVIDIIKNDLSVT